MNKEHLEQIFAHYIEKFEYINNPDYRESYKWGIAKTFRTLMDEALISDDSSFAAALYKAKSVTSNLIDSYTQPFHGLVEFARKEPQTVRQMFLDLYAEDSGDLDKRQEKVAAFFQQSQILQERYYPNSYRYKQNSHSVSAYLFLYDPDHHYMFKATQAAIFADCVEFYEDWGSGDAIKLDVFYRMCDQLVEAIKGCDPLLVTDRSRFSGKFGYERYDMHPDSEKHILAFDLIYCCSVYNLFNGIAFDRPKTKDKQLYIERREKAEQLMQEHQKAIDDFNNLQSALDYFVTALPIGTKIVHKAFGAGEVVFVDEATIEIEFGSAERKKFGLPIVIANKLLSADVDGFDEKQMLYASLLKRESAIRNAVSWSEKALRPYEEYLD